MKDEVLGLNHLLSLPATCQTVSPRSSALSSGHLRIAPPKSSSGRPRCFWYHAAKAALSPLLLKNTPPTPVTLAIDPLSHSRFGLCYSRPAMLAGSAARTLLIVDKGWSGNRASWRSSSERNRRTL